MEALNFLASYDREASTMCTNVMNTQWDFNTNITEITKQRMVSVVTIIIDNNALELEIALCWVVIILYI